MDVQEAIPVAADMFAAGRNPNLRNAHGHLAPFVPVDLGVSISRPMFCTLIELCLYRPGTSELPAQLKHTQTYP